MKRLARLLTVSFLVLLVCITCANVLKVDVKGATEEESEKAKEIFIKEITGDGDDNKAKVTVTKSAGVLSIRIKQSFTVPSGRLDVKIGNETITVNASVYSDALYEVLSGYHDVSTINFIGQGTGLIVEYSSDERDDWLHKLIQEYKSTLNEVNLEGVVLNNDYNASYLFQGCASLQSVELPDVTSCNIADASYMFDSCKMLNRVNWDSIFNSSLDNAEGMLSNSGITTLDISKYTASGISGISESKRQDFLYRSNVTEVIIPDGVQYYLHIGGNADKVWVTDKGECYQDGSTTDSSAGGSYRLKNRISKVNIVYLFGNQKPEVQAEDYDVSTDFDIFSKEVEKLGYTYDGCYLDSNCSNQVRRSITAYSMYEPTLYYKYTPVTYKIFYNDVDQGVMRYYNYTVEDSFNLEAGVKEGRDFKGWYTTKNFYPDTYINKITKGMTGDLDLYPKWEYHKYNITYVLNGGTNHKLNKKTYTCEDAFVSLYNPKKKGCKFLGWYYDSSFENQCTILRTSSLCNITLYAKWEDPDKSIKPGKVKGIKLSSKGRRITVKFKKDKKYKTSVYISGRKDMYFPDTFSVKQKGTKITSAKLKRGKIYYVRLRHYKKSKTSGKIIYGKWSKIYKIRVKR